MQICTIGCVEEVTQLPRGRHRLTREEVLASQRGRMLEAMAHAVLEKGYVRATVADVLSRARVSRETFYEHFADKEDCFLAAYELAIEALGETIAAAIPTRRATPLTRLRRALAAYLDALAQEGAIARVFLVDVYAAGPRALARRREVMDRFVATMSELLDARTSDERFAVEALVGAISSLVTVRVAAGEYEQLPELLGPILEIAPRFLPSLERRSA
jgi:AcrR family transcriptional regulator